MEEKNIIYDCSRGCTTERTENGELICNYSHSCCKLADFDWLEGISDPKFSNLYEVRFKNTRKGFYENTSHQLLKTGDLVVVEAATGHDVGIITLSGPVVGRQMVRAHFDMDTKELKKIYRKARPLDLEKWQEAIARESSTMIRARQIAAELGLDMKIGDVEFQGDGSKAIFYYIADERVDFRQLIKVFAEEFRIRIEMKQIGARQEAGLIGGLGVCGRALCCAKFITNFQSISTQAARCQDLSLNPQKLAGQCGKLKCCINAGQRAAGIHGRAGMAGQGGRTQRHHVVLIRAGQCLQGHSPDSGGSPQNQGRQPERQQAGDNAKRPG